MPLRLVPQKTKIPFLEYRKIAIILSSVLLITTVVLLSVRGLNYGIDFTGGKLIQIQTQKAADTATIRATLKAANFENATIQSYGDPTEFLIRVPADAELNEETVINVLQPVTGFVTVRRVEFVGPQVGEELREKGLLAILFALGATLIYITLRFEFRYGLGAIVALVHDVFLTVGMFSLIQKEISLTVLAAVLTVIGYSLNDTIVVFDRIRENRSRFSKLPLIDVLNQSVNQTLNRTLMTSLTTIVVLVALFVLGGAVIHDFAFTLLFGVIVGTYSSVFVASPVLLMLEDYYKKLQEEDETNNQ